MYVPPETDGRNTNMTKNHRIEQSGLVDHLHKDFYQNQCTHQKLEYLRMTLTDQVVREIIMDGICKLCELEKEWINRLQTFNPIWAGIFANLKRLGGPFWLPLLT